MKKTIIIIVVALIYGFLEQQGVSIPSSAGWSQSSEDTLENAYDNKRSDIQVQASGVVIKLLPDDLNGSRHQRFILRTSNRQTVLVAHNIDLAPKINRLNKGDTVEFYGEYEWQSKGGIIHWTHHDPNGRHISGWLKHKGNMYQ